MVTKERSPTAEGRSYAATGSPRTVVADSPKRRQRDQARFWEEKYRRDPAFFGRGPSPFAKWSLAFLRTHGPAPTIVEIGCGYGRDVAFFAQRGFRVLAVDATQRGVSLARAALADSRPNAGRVSIQRCSALTFLRRLPPRSADAVFSNLVWNMDFTTPEHRAHFRAVRRVLRPGGTHLYSVRATSDPWYRRGRQVGPRRYDLAPNGTVMHFFSPRYARTLARATGFTPVELVERPEGGRAFPVRVLYVADRRPPRVGASARRL